MVEGRGLVERMRRAALLDATLYDEVEHDQSALPEAVLVVVIAAVASLLGNLLNVFEQGPRHVGLVSEIASMLANWVVWSYVTYFVGTRLFGGTATPGEMLRALGFAMSPGALNILGAVPCVGGLIRVAVLIWILVAGVVAVRAAQDCTNADALGTVVVGGMVMLGLFVLQLLVLGALGVTVRLL
ncbi:MAG TPA: YIP1 family protein [Chloroflexota bacterium]|nr:YIP1 family protein [Chloroflexota bacterium]